MTADLVGVLQSDPELWVLGAALAALLALIVALIGTTLRLRARNNRTQARWIGLEERWQPLVLASIAGRISDADLHAQVSPAEALFFIDYLLRFARRLEGEERATIERLARPLLPILVARLQHRDDEFRARAVQTISALGLQEYGHIVVAALDDRSDLVAMVAARSLSQPGTPEFASAVIRRLARFRQWRSSFLASMLARVGPEIAPSLREALLDPNTDIAVRVVAADALRELNDPESAVPAAVVLSTTSDRNLIVACLGILMEVGHQRHLPPVRALVSSDEPIVRARAFATIARLDDQADLSLLRGAMNDPSPWVPIRVIEALRAAGATTVLQRIAQGPEISNEFQRALRSEAQS